MLALAAGRFFTPPKVLQTLWCEIRKVPGGLRRQGAGDLPNAHLFDESSTWGVGGDGHISTNTESHCAHGNLE